jgi:hypothetical protein
LRPSTAAIAVFRSVVRAQKRLIDLGDGPRQSIRYAGIEELGALEFPRLEGGAHLACGRTQACIQSGRAFYVGEV